MISSSNFIQPSRQLLSTVLVAASMLIAPAAQASLSVSPLVVELDSRQGQAQGTITVGNSGDDPFRARSYAVPFTYDRETGFKELKQATNDLTPYLQFSPPEVSIPGADKRRVRFITRLAPSLPDGEYRAMIFTETLNQIVPPEVVTSGETTVTTTILPRLGVAVYVRKGKLSPSLAIDSLRFNAPEQQPQILVKNTGKATAIVKSEWTIKQADREITKGLVQDTTVIAEGDRYVTIKLPETTKLAPGEYQLQGNLLWGFNHSQKIPYQFKFTVPATK
jgi:P pilus assembly chaperone PapD